MSEDGYKKFHQENPHVFTELTALAFQAAGAGRRMVGIKHLIEVLRWNRELVTNGKPFKINNNHAPRYARDIVYNYPSLKGMFVTRKSKFDSTTEGVNA